MNELEKKIYECALKKLPEAMELVKKTQTQTKARYIEIPFLCDGCIDGLVYDKALERFTKIRYAKGSGVGTVVDYIFKCSTFDEIELCEIDIDKKL